VVPSGIWIWKKPLPSIAMSRLFEVWFSVPCEKLREVAAARTPRPICRPVGSWLCSEVAEPAWRRFWYIRSSNTTPARL